MSLKGVNALPRTDIPQSHSLVITATRQSASIGTKADAVNFFGMPKPSVQAFSRADVPQSYSLVVTASSDGHAIGTKRH
jgi:hypothetical protein